MPTEEQNTVKLTDAQIKQANDLFLRAGKGEFSKDPANPPPQHRIKNADFPNEDKQDW